MSKDKGMQHVGEIVRSLVPTKPIFSEDFIPSEDIAYTHSLFLQCFMPLRHAPANERRWQTNHRDASLVIRAGEVPIPGKKHAFRECSVPAGPKARLIAIYINNYAWKHKRPTIDLGESMREFMDMADVRICGSNGRELKRELENFAAAEIMLGEWGPDRVLSPRTKVAGEMSFWLEKNPDQRTIWTPQMQLSPQYFETVIKGRHIAPVHWPSYVALQRSPRAMDIHGFLTYRLRKPLMKPARISVVELHQMFGQDCKRLAHFLPRFEDDLKKAWALYQTARVELTKETDITKRHLILRSSPPLIPYKKQEYLGAG